MATTRTHDGQAADPAVISEMISAAYRDHAAAIHGTALRSTRDPEVAADVTQEAFLRLLTEAQAGRYPENVGGWLYRTSANLIISRGRHATVARRLAPRLVRVDLPERPDEAVLVHEQHRDIELALATLSTAERVALLLAANGATGDEIAGHLGRSHGATRTLLCRARVRLRTAMIQIEAPESRPSAAFGRLRAESRA